MDEGGLERLNSFLEYFLHLWLQILLLELNHILSSCKLSVVGAQLHLHTYLIIKLLDKLLLFFRVRSWRYLNEVGRPLLLQLAEFSLILVVKHCHSLFFLHRDLASDGHVTHDPVFAAGNDEVLVFGLVWVLGEGVVAHLLELRGGLHALRTDLYLFFEAGG